MKTRKGFTLVELLVVIGIIALLIGMLMPVLSKARAAAGSVRCKSNLHQLGVAYMLYLLDNKYAVPVEGNWGGNLPPEPASIGPWPLQLSPYIRKVSGPAANAIAPLLVCPSSGSDPSAMGYYEPDYGCNQLAAFRPLWNSYYYTTDRRYGATRRPGEVIALMDYVPGWRWVEQSQGQYMNIEPNRSIIFRHPNHTANALYMDTHVESIPSPIVLPNPWFPPANQLPWQSY